MAHHTAASNLIFLPVRRYISTTASKNAASASAHSEAVRSACTAEHAAYRTGEATAFPPHISREKYSPSESGTPLAAPFRNTHAAA